MKHIFFLLFFLPLILCGCDTGHGISRSAKIEHLPDIELVERMLLSYPEIDKVDIRKKETSKKEKYEFSYSSKKVFGTLRFEKNREGKNGTYNQNLIFMSIDMRDKFYQELMDATWPIMKKIENDLIEKFNMPEIRDSLKVDVFGIEHPERKLPSPTKGNK
jgi:hypothetical protein